MLHDTLQVLNMITRVMFMLFEVFLMHRLNEIYIKKIPVSLSYKFDVTCLFLWENAYLPCNVSGKVLCNVLY